MGRHQDHTGSRSAGRCEVGCSCAPMAPWAGSSVHHEPVADMLLLGSWCPGHRQGPRRTRPDPQQPAPGRHRDRQGGRGARAVRGRGRTRECAQPRAVGHQRAGGPGVHDRERPRARRSDGFRPRCTGPAIGFHLPMCLGAATRKVEMNRIIDQVLWLERQFPEKAVWSRRPLPGPATCRASCTTP